MNHGYEIKCKNNAELLKRMKFLFSKGFVFCSVRYREMSVVRREFFDYRRWTYIWVGHDQECKKVMNTGIEHKINWGGVPVKVIEWDEFQKLM